MGAKKQKKSLKLYLGDLFLLNVTYLLIHFIGFPRIGLDYYYGIVLIVLNGAWLSVSLLTQRLQFEQYRSFPNMILGLGQSMLFMMYFTALAAVLFGVTGSIQLHLLGSYIGLYVFEVCGLTLWHYLASETLVFKPAAAKSRRRRSTSPALVAADAFLLLISFSIVNFNKTGSFSFHPKAFPILLVFIGFWMLTGRWTRKFEYKQYQNIYYAYSPYIKAAFLTAASMALLIFTFRLFEYSRTLVFGPVVFLLIFEFPLAYLYYIYQNRKSDVKDIESAEQVLKIFQEESQELPREKPRKVKEPVKEKLASTYLKDVPHLLKFIEKNIDTEKIDVTSARVLNTHTFYNIQTLENQSLDLIINLHKVNDFRRINQYFLETHRKFYNGGYLVGCKDTIRNFRERIFARYPNYMARVFYGFYFVVGRVFPKLPWIKKLYFAFSRGRNRVVSQAELMGRLHFCGFKVVDLEEINGNLYFIAQKIKNPSLDQNPSYGPLVDLKRIGYQGKVFYAKKLRTMHPYSEYIQDYVFNSNSLQDNGKFNNDFRITEWGKVFRKLWIDELPQLINYFRGDVGIFGVRALSEHYFSLYPKDLQELRIQFKPGLIPPYYADMPKSFDEIIESERRYLVSKQQKPLATDIKYFGKAVYNIVFRHARSR